MPQFFVPRESIRDGRCRITDGDARHLTRVRRVREGDIISIRDHDGRGYRARVDAVHESSVEAVILATETGLSPVSHITLACAVLKGKSFDLVIQKSVEVGVGRIIPLLTERTVPDLKGREEKKLDRWRKIAGEAAKQAMSPSVPAVDRVCAFNEAVHMEFPGVKILAHTDGDSGFRGLDRDPAGAVLMVGPEGGFSGAEVERARERGWQVRAFGFTHLRAETAAVVLPALIIHEWSEK